MRAMRIVLALALMAALLCPATAEGEPLHVVTTVFALYDWTREVTNGVEGVEITFLLGDGVDMHSYQPSVTDIMALVNCDLFICVGGESDAWAEEALSQAGGDARCLRLLDAQDATAMREERREGMQVEKGTGNVEDEWDEHIWLSLKNARACTRAIAEALAELDDVHAGQYADNADVYGEKLAELDARFAAMVEAAPLDTLLFGDRFPFRYLVEDYGLQYYAAFQGCAAESEASFDTIIFLVNRLDELDLPAVLTIETGTARVAEAIVANSHDRDQEIIALNSMQGVTVRQAEEGLTYLACMEENFEKIARALGAG